MPTGDLGRSDGEQLQRSSRRGRSGAKALADSRVVLADHDGNQAQIHGASIGYRPGTRHDDATSQRDSTRLEQPDTRSVRSGWAAFQRKRIVKPCTRRLRRGRGGPWLSGSGDGRYPRQKRISVTTAA